MFLALRPSHSKLSNSYQYTDRVPQFSAPQTLPDRSPIHSQPISSMKCSRYCRKVPLTLLPPGSPGSPLSGGFPFRSHLQSFFLKFVQRFLRFGRGGSSTEVVPHVTPPFTVVGVVIQQHDDGASHQTPSPGDIHNPEPPNQKSSQVKSRGSSQVNN